MVDIFAPSPATPLATEPERIGKYLLVVETRIDNRKTRLWCIVGNDGTPLATIAWWGPWRQYVMVPGAGTIFNATCLRDIVAFLDRVNAAHRAAR